MIFTLQHAKDFCAKFVDDGRCSDSNIVVDRINEASRIMLDEADWKSTLRKMRFRITNNCIAMPHYVEAVRKVNFGYYPANVWGMVYEFIDGGPGTLICDNNTVAEDLVDLGDGFPTFWKIGATPRQIMAFSTAEADIDLQMRIRGLDSSHMEIEPTVPGEMLHIQRWQNGIEGTIDGDNIGLSTSSFQQVTSIVKPETTGYVTLLAYDPTTNDIWVLGKYGPYETHPAYRRYRITASCPTEQECITLLVKVRYVPLQHDSDVLPIQNLEAYKWMLKAIGKFNRDDLDGGAAFQALAIRALQKQLSNTQSSGRQIDVKVLGYGEGDSSNMV